MRRIRGVVSDSQPEPYCKGSDWGKRPCFICGKNTTVKPAAWTPPLLFHDGYTHKPAKAACPERLCAKCRDWTPPTGRFKATGVNPESLAAKGEYELAPTDYPVSWITW